MLNQINKPFAIYLLSYINLGAKQSRNTRGVTTTMSSALRNSITSSMGRSRLGGGGAKSTMGLAAASFFHWGTEACRASMRARSTAQPQRPRGLRLQEEVTRRTLAPTMRAGVSGRSGSSGAAWHRGG